jgi:hypothetical protein
MEWFRFYDEALDDPKVQKMPATLFKYWVNLLCLANRGTPRGALPPIGDIAFALRIDDETAEKLMLELRKRDLIEDVEGLTYPHNWNARQFKSDNTTARVNEWRKQRKNETVHATLQDDSNVDATSQPADDETLHATPPEQRQNRTETEQSDPPAPAGHPPQGEPKPKQRRAVRTAIKPDWEPDASLLGWCAEKGFAAGDIEAEAERFRNHYLGNGELRADWAASFRNWMTSPLRGQARARASPLAPRPGSRGENPHRWFAAAERLAAEEGDPRP